MKKSLKMKKINHGGCWLSDLFVSKKKNAAATTTTTTTITRQASNSNSNSNSKSKSNNDIFYNAKEFQSPPESIAKRTTTITRTQNIREDQLFSKKPPMPPPPYQNTEALAIKEAAWLLDMVKFCGVVRNRLTQTNKEAWNNLSQYLYQGKRVPTLERVPYNNTGAISKCTQSIDPLASIKRKFKAPDGSFMYKDSPFYVHKLVHNLLEQINDTRQIPIIQ